jgi:hypothetical protein
MRTREGRLLQLGPAIELELMDLETVLSPALKLDDEGLR